MFHILLFIFFHTTIPVIDGFSYHRNWSSSATRVCPPREEFPCKNGMCVDVDYICDEDDDCLDNSDEATYLCRDYSDNDELPGLIFVMDITPSMKPELETIVNMSLRFLDAITRQEKIFTDFKFIAFSGDSVWPSESSKNLPQFRSFIGNMTTKNIREEGYEGPLVLSAILKAVNEAVPNSKIFVFTDWSPSDRALLPNITSLLARKRCEVIIFLTTYTSPPMEYRKIASISKGQTLNVFYKALDQFQSFIQWMAQPHLRNLLAEDIGATLNVVNNSSRSYNCSIPEDITDLTFAINRGETRSMEADVHGFNLTDENGNEIRPSSTISSRRATIIRIKHPEFKTLVVNVKDKESPYTIRVTGSIREDINFTYGFSLSDDWNAFTNEFSLSPFPDYTNYLYVKPSTVFRSHVKVIPISCELKSFPNHTFIHRIKLASLPDSTDGTYFGTYRKEDLTKENFYLKVRGSVKRGSFFDEIISSPIQPLPQAIVIRISQTVRVSSNSSSIPLVTLHCYVESAAPYFILWTRNESMLNSISARHTQIIAVHHYELSSADSCNEYNSYRCTVLHDSTGEDRWIKSSAIKVKITNSTSSNLSSSTPAVTSSQPTPSTAVPSVTTSTPTTTRTTTSTTTRAATESTPTPTDGIQTDSEPYDSEDTTPFRPAPSVPEVIKKKSNGRGTYFFFVVLIVFLIIASGIFIRKQYFERRADSDRNVDLSYLRYSKSFNSLETLDPSH